MSRAHPGRASISFYVAATSASCQLAGVCSAAAASNSATRTNLEKICQSAGAPCWTGKNHRKTARERQGRRFEVTPHRSIRLPPKRLPPKASTLAESCHAYRCSSTSDGKSSCLTPTIVALPLKADTCGAFRQGTILNLAPHALSQTTALWRRIPI